MADVPHPDESKGEGIRIKGVGEADMVGDEKKHTPMKTKGRG